MAIVLVTTWQLENAKSVERLPERLQDLIEFIYHISSLTKMVSEETVTFRIA